MATLVNHQKGSNPYTVTIDGFFGTRSLSQRVKTKTEADALALTWAREHKGRQVNVYRGRKFLGCTVISPGEGGGQ